MGKFNYFNLKEKRLDKLSPKEQEDLVFDLINAFALMRNPIESALLLQDLFTETEVRNLAKRLRIAKLLLAGKTHEEIVRELHCSYATATKVRIWLDRAGQGLKKVIQRLPKRRKVYYPKRIPGIGYGLPQILLSLTSTALKAKERKMIGELLEGMRGKSVLDRDFKEEVDADFAEKARKRKRL